jgi:hypothetical protein
MAIILPSGFVITNNEPADSRITLADSTARFGLSFNNVYEGLIVYQRDTDQIYVLVDPVNVGNSAGWVLLQSSTFDSGSFVTTSSFNNYTGSITSQFAGTASYAFTASYALNAGTTIDTGSFVTTSSFNSFTGSYNTGSFTGSFTGNGSGLTGITSTLAVSGSTGNGTINLKTQALTITGTANEIETSMASQTLTIGLPNDVIVSNDLTVQGDLVINGTASFQNTENLLVADRFVLFASGSVTVGDGGIVVQQGTQDVGELFGYDSTATRWGFTSSFNVGGTTFTPTVYVGAVQTGTGQTATSAAPIYGGSTYGLGTLHIDTDDSEIWIYA